MPHVLIKYVHVLICGRAHIKLVESFLMHIPLESGSYNKTCSESQAIVPHSYQKLWNQWHSLRGGRGAPAPPIWVFTRLSALLKLFTTTERAMIIVKVPLMY